MTATDESRTVEFRQSTRRRILATALGLVAVAAVGVVVSLARGRQWWDLLWMLPLFLVLGATQRSAHRPRLPLRLTEQHLEVTGPSHATVAIEWSNVARAEIRGRLTSVLVVEPVAPDRTRPPLRRWQWAGHGRSRPYELVVPLAGMTPGRGVLRRELARRLA
ncbi:hypothetical protein ACTMS2_17385 [Micromonospora sp. SD12]|uniref:hypothetical protein n=1 Tax=Micromonospora sp. SD12 TaxID=3452216 RepID=UPI003F895C7F